MNAQERAKARLAKVRASVQAKRGPRKEAKVPEFWMVDGKPMPMGAVEPYEAEFEVNGVQVSATKFKYRCEGIRAGGVTFTAQQLNAYRKAVDAVKALFPEESDRQDAGFDF